MPDASRPPSAALAALFDAVMARLEGRQLVEAALRREPDLVEDAGPQHVLALGKAAGSMLGGLVAARGLPTGRILSVTTGPPRAGELVGIRASDDSEETGAPAMRAKTGAPAEPVIGGSLANVTWMIGSHPAPDRRSLAAGRAIAGFVASLRPPDRLTVLLSGGGSALAVLPPAGVPLPHKREVTRALARAGAGIHALNVVRKHLSRIKGGRLATATTAAISVLALSDVVGDDPGTIASGPFSPDPSTFAQAADILARFGVRPPASVQGHLERGRAGLIDETPKPGSGALDHVDLHVVAGPQTALDTACAVARERGYAPEVLARNLEDEVEPLARRYADAARALAANSAPSRLLVGNGEPTLRVHGGGRGGRSTHLALLVGRAIAGLPGITFLAAGTDGQDGSAAGAGAVVDGQVWGRAIARGYDPEAALRRFDSATLLEALGCLVPGRTGTNLLDLHFLAAQPGGA